MIKEDLEKIKLPDLLTFNNGQTVKDKEEWKRRREEIKEIISREEYGYFPKEHAKISWEIIEEEDNYCGGTAIFRKVLIKMHMEEDFSFPIKIAIPKLKEKCKACIYLDFHDTFPNKNLPVNEICDNGFAVISVCYKDITDDNDDFTDGLSRSFKAVQGKRDFGKILIWSWAAMHIMDYVQTLEEIDKNNIAIVGLSRLGKTALLTGAFDERFRFVISNNSGQSGAAISRNKEGETIKDICERFPYWFSTNYQKYIDNENKQEFDQHFLASLVAPRYLYVASASEDRWADPKAEFRCCIETTKVYNLLNEKGLIYDKKDYPIAGEDYLEGDIGYHLRQGTHYLTRYDWQRFMKYMNIHKK